MSRFFEGLLTFVLVASITPFVFGQKTEKRSAPEVSVPGLVVVNSLAASDGRGAFLRWTTASERGILGFYIYRDAKPDNPAFVPGGYLRSRIPEFGDGEYTYFDTVGGIDSEYLVEAVDINGRRTRLGNLKALEVSDLRLVAGRSSAELALADNAKPIESSRNLIPESLKRSIRVLAPDPVNQKWVAAQPGVKILVRQKGIYRVTRTQLETAGFNVAASSNTWRLFVEGNEQPLTIGPADSFIEFFGEGMNTPESDVRAYFLIADENANGKRVTTRVMRPISSPVIMNGFLQTYRKLERASYLSGILNGPAENFFGATPIGNSSTYNYSLNLAAIDYAVPRSTVRVSLVGLTVNPHDVQVTINGQVMATNIVFGGQLNGVGTYEVDTSLLVQGTNTIQLRGLAGANDFTVLESVSVDYSRKFEADQNQLSFYTNFYKTSVLTGFSSANVRIFDVTVPDNPVEVLGLNAVSNGATFDLRMPSNRAGVFYAAEASAIRAPVSIVRNYPSHLSTPQNSADLIVVTHRDLLTEAQTWANYRTSQGTSSVVIDVADIFDEYSYGIQKAEVMTQFFQYARDNWTVGPKFVLLMGDSTYDPKNYGNLPFNSFVPTEMVDTLYEETGSDEALCDFNNDGLAELAVGRLPVRLGSEVGPILAKVTQFEANLTNVLNRGALFVADQPIGYDFEGVNNRVSQQLPTGMQKVFVSRTNPDARNLLLTELNAGHYLVNYSGHGSTLFWAASNFYHKNDIPNMTNQNNYSIFTLLTCLNGYYLMPTFDVFGETMIKQPNAGGVVVWASSGKTTPDVQEIMATRFYNQIGIGNITQIGDLVKDAKQSLIGGRDVRLSWTLFGDPAMKVR